MLGRKLIQWLRLAALIFAVTSVAGTLELLVYRLYHNLESRQLQIAAEMAVRAGAEYLPTDLNAAIATADASARHYGVAWGEIAFIGTAPDGLTLTIELHRKLPWYKA